MWALPSDAEGCGVEDEVDEAEGPVRARGAAVKAPVRASGGAIADGRAEDVLAAVASSTGPY